jgi:hypothetical protein
METLGQVHPVPPVMDITRQMCVEWNERLQAKIEEGEGGKASCGLSLAVASERCCVASVQPLQPVTCVVCVSLG